MKVCIGILALISAFAVVATVVYRFGGKREKQRLKNLYIFIFYAFILYGVMSFIKIVLGEPDKHLFDSFYDMEAVTYIHYGAPMLIFTIIMSFLHGRFLKNEFINRFVMLFNSIFSFAVMAEFLIWGIIDNKCFVITIVATAVIGLFVSIFYRGKVEYCNKENAKGRLFYILPVIMLWTVTAIIFEPNQLLLNNFGEFNILPYLRFLWVTVSAALLITLIYTLTGLLVLSDRQLKLFGALLFGVAFAGYIQGNFLNGKMRIMDGSAQNWSIQTKLINGIIWGIIILASICINLLVGNKKVKKVCPVICIYLCLTQTVSLTYILKSRPNYTHV